MAPSFGLIIVGDEFCRTSVRTSTCPKVIELLRGEALRFLTPTTAITQSDSPPLCKRAFCIVETLFFLWRHRGNAR